MALAAKLKNIDGILGVATFVKEHKVKIYYDENKISQTEVQETLFTPSEVLLRVLSEDEIEIMEVKVWLNNFFDQSDFNYLSRLLQEKTEAIFVSSEFDCPVLVSIYFTGNAKIDKGGLIKLLESKKFSYQLNENNQTVDLGYIVAKGPEFNKMTKAEFTTKFFDPYEAEFNNYEQYSSSVIGLYEIPFGKNRIVRNKVNFLVSHLSNEPGVVKFRIFLNDSLEETIAISYVDTITNTKNILEKLNTDTLQITYTSGEEDKIKNMFEFGKN
jgi:copper chaperone CopZ